MRSLTTRAYVTVKRDLRAEIAVLEEEKEGAAATAAAAEEGIRAEETGALQAAANPEGKRKFISARSLETVKAVKPK